MVQLNEAEQRFAAYMDDHGYAWKYEPDYQAELSLPAPLATKPDFLVERGGARGVAEVRQFETTAIRDALGKAGGYMTTGSKTAYGPLRLGILEKADQLRPLAGAGLPLLIVLANPLNADVMLDPQHVMAAMWGNPGYVVPIDTRVGGRAEGQEAFWRLQDYGVFASPIKQGDQVVGWENRNPHISAVVVAHQRLRSADWREEIVRAQAPTDDTLDAAAEATVRAMREVKAAIERGEEPAGAYRWVTVYEVNGDDAVSVPGPWFDGERDVRYGFTGDGYGRLSPKPST